MGSLTLIDCHFCTFGAVGASLLYGVLRTDTFSFPAESNPFKNPTLMGVPASSTGL